MNFCFDHPAKQPLILVREWQVIACDNNPCAAMLLSFFEYWHSIKIDQSSKARHLNKVAQAHGDEPTQDTSLLQFHSEAELQRGILGIYKKDKIRSSIKLLVEKRFISVHKNPNDRYKFDQTRYFLLEEDNVRCWLEKHKESLNLSNSGKSVKEERETASDDGKTASDNREIEIDLYTEITPETSTEREDSPTPQEEKSKEFSRPKTRESITPVPCQKNKEAVVYDGEILSETSIPTRREKVSREENNSLQAYNPTRDFEDRMRLGSSDPFKAWWNVFDTGSLALDGRAGPEYIARSTFQRLNLSDRVPELMRGTELYLKKCAEDKARTGRAAMYGAKKFLEDAVWLDECRREEIQSQLPQSAFQPQSAGDRANQDERARFLRVVSMRAAEKAQKENHTEIAS
jgi:hypothetical protein